MDASNVMEVEGEIRKNETRTSPLFLFSSTFPLIFFFAIYFSHFFTLLTTSPPSFLPHSHQ